MSVKEQVRVISVDITRKEITSDDIPELLEIYRLTKLPLAPTHVSIEIMGVPSAVVNALRRVVLDEMPGYALKVPIDGFSTELTTECFMIPQFVNNRISLLRLRPQIPAEVIAKLRLKLDISNQNATFLNVYAGDLEVVEGSMTEPIFNPTTVIAMLQPGKRIVINGIHISTGYGRDNGVYNVACRGTYTHLDLPQHSDSEMRDANGAAVDLSGYKVSTLVANPRHHRLSAIIPATTANLSEARAVFADACAVIIARLRLIYSTIERQTSGKANHRGIQFNVIQLESGLNEGTLQIPGETHTIGELLRRIIYEITPEISNVMYNISSHENLLSLSVRHSEDVTDILMKAIQRSVAIFEAIQKGII